jgi:ectoine hydroxylase-related dioxygenase (phytanoyl-CoA dioxygenase family)
MSPFDENGFQIIDNAISTESCDKIHKTIETASNLRQPHLKFPAILMSFAESPLRPFLAPPWHFIRSIFFDKTPEANWGVPWHQDLTICVRERRDAPGFGPWSIKDGLHHVHAPAEILDQILTIRVHLDDCTPENGALSVLPGSHKLGRMTDQQIESFRATHPEITCSIRKGGVLLMKPLLLHASSRATNPTHRRVLHFEVTQSTLPHGLEWI